MLLKKNYTFLLTAIFGVILYTLISGKIKILINPMYQKFLIVSEIILLLFIVYSLIGGHSHAGSRYFLKALPLAVICLLIILSSYTDYQINAAAIKSVTIGSTAVKASVTTPMAKNTPAPMAVPDSNTVPMNDTDFIKILTGIYDDPDAYDGKEITIKGFAAYSDFLGDSYFIIARLAMYCCAADAEVTGLACDSSSTDLTVEKNSWYELTGTLESRELTLAGGTGQYPVIRVGSIKKIKALSSPYVYPF